MFDLRAALPLIVVCVGAWVLSIIGLIVLARELSAQQPDTPAASLPAEATVELPDGTVVSAEEAAALRRMQLKWLALPAKVR
jgi:hypothetical protein